MHQANPVLQAPKKFSHIFVVDKINNFKHNYLTIIYKMYFGCTLLTNQTPKKNYSVTLKYETL